MTRRSFLKTSGAGALALAAAKTSLFAVEEEKPLRVALIGCGWYGKTDLFHLIQVAPVEVVGVSDVYSKMAEAAAAGVERRQPSKKNPLVFGSDRKLLADTRTQTVPHGHPDRCHVRPVTGA